MHLQQKNKCEVVNPQKWVTDNHTIKVPKTKTNTKSNIQTNLKILQCPACIYKQVVAETRDYYSLHTLSRAFLYHQKFPIYTIKWEQQNKKKN